MSSCKISIVVAMYNIENYIIHCLDSCDNQVGVTSNDYEVIIVNDGSSDNSPKLVNEYIANRPNFRMLTKSNGGLSSARNVGMHDAKGEYIWFVDGDDAIASDSISVLKHNVIETNCDAYILNFKTFEHENVILQGSNFRFGNHVFSGREYHNSKLELLPQMAWLTIYNLSFLKTNNLFFVEGIIHEDYEFSIRAHHLCTNIAIVSECLYLYRISRADSIMNKIKKDNAKSLGAYLKILESHKCFFASENTPFTRKIYCTTLSFFFRARYSDSFSKNSETENLLKNNKTLYKILWQSGYLKYRCFLFAILLLPSFVLVKISQYLSTRSRLF